MSYPPLDVSQLEQLLALSESMVAHIQREDWEALAQHDEQRRLILTSNGSIADVIQEDESRRQTLIDAVSQQDKRMLESMQQARDGVVAEGSKQRAQRTAQKIYSSAQSWS